MDLYEEKNFDEWLDESVKQEILRELKEKWDEATENNCVFVSAVEKKNIDALRELILQKVRDLYQVRYPYRTMQY
jgi:GTP-binding protein HflX